MTGARYRLQRRESVPNMLGNHSMPVYTYRWKDIAVSDDKAALTDIMPQGDRYRIEDTRPQEARKENQNECGN